VLKINAKLGGQHSLLASVGGAPKLFPHEHNPFMIIGADVTHPMGFNRSTPSIASVVGSIDRYATRYAERSRLQGHRVEMIQVRSALIQPDNCNLILCRRWRTSSASCNDQASACLCKVLQHSLTLSL